MGGSDFLKKVVGRGEQREGSQAIVPAYYPFTAETGIISSSEELEKLAKGSIQVKSQDGKLPTRIAVKPIFNPDYVFGRLPAVHIWRHELPPAERDLIARIDEAKECAKMPDAQGVWNFFATVWKAAEEGRAYNPPMNVFETFRAEIGWAVRNNLIGGGLELVAKNIRYAADPWEFAVAKQLQVVDATVQLCGREGIKQVAPADFTKVFILLRDAFRRRIDLAMASGQHSAANTLEVAYGEISTAYQTPIPLHVPRRLGHGNVRWQ